MKATGIVRRIDELGRVVIPKEIRSQLNIQNDVDSFEIYMEGGRVILQKYIPTCIFCDSLRETVKYAGYNVCSECIEKLFALKDEAK